MRSGHSDTSLAVFLLLSSLTLNTASADGSPEPFMSAAQWIGMYESGEAGREAAAAYVAGYGERVLEIVQCLAVLQLHGVYTSFELCNDELWSPRRRGRRQYKNSRCRVNSNV